MPGPLNWPGAHTTMSCELRLSELYWSLCDPGCALSEIRRRPIRIWPSVTFHRLSLAASNFVASACIADSGTFSANAMLNVTTTGGVAPLEAYDSGPARLTDGLSLSRPPLCRSQE